MPGDPYLLEARDSDAPAAISEMELEELRAHRRLAVRAQHDVHVELATEPLQELQQCAAVGAQGAIAQCA